MAHAMGKPGWGDLGLWWACAQLKLGRQSSASGTKAVQGLKYSARAVASAAWRVTPFLSDPTRVLMTVSIDPIAT